ncbi:MAG: aminotransferase, partial [Rhodobacteraceae bacterium]|nr:aminotransferase [Paracoccaceae bacterium]
AILRPQLRDLAAQCARWNDRYTVVDERLRDTPGLTIVARPPAEGFVASSYQFLLLDWAADKVQEVVQRCAARGVELKWFGAPEPVGFTSRYDSWDYAPHPPMPETDRVLAGILDMRLPLTFSLDDCDLIARIIRAEVSAVWQSIDA